MRRRDLDILMATIILSGDRGASFAHANNAKPALRFYNRKYIFRYSGSLGETNGLIFSEISGRRARD